MAKKRKPAPKGKRKGAPIGQEPGERLEDDIAALEEALEARGENPEEPWLRLKGETTRQYAAFETFRQIPPYERSVAETARRLGLRQAQNCYRWSRCNHWLARAQAWDEHQAFVQQESARESIRTMSQRQIRSLEYVQRIANMHLTRVFEQLQRELQADDQAVPGFLTPRDLIAWVKNAQLLETEARLRLVDPVLMAGVEAQAADRESEALAAWHGTFVEPERTFMPHPTQKRMIASKARFAASVAGVQSGKTSGSAIAFWRRLLDDRQRLAARNEQGFYWLIAPNSLVGEVMCEAFETFAPPGQIVSKTGRGSGMTWSLSDGSRVQFRSAEKADTLVARRLHGCWLDEFTLLKDEVWKTSVRQRLVTTGGWAIFSGTPRGKNWAYEEIWRRCLEHDDRHDEDYEGFTWHSEENPMVSAEEIEAAKRQLPDSYFRREYRASWESFHGQIYQDWDEESMVVKGLADRPAPKGSKHVVGVDWGTANPGCAVLLRKLPNGVWHVMEEIYEAEKLPSWWTEEITRLWQRAQVEEIHCDPEDPGRIMELEAIGLPAQAANNAVHAGIRTVAALMRQQRLFVDARCKNVIRQLAGYHWHQDTRGNRREFPAKVNDHACDAVRYGIHSEGEQVLVIERSGYRGPKHG